MKNLLKKLFPSKKDRDVKQLRPYADSVNVEYEKLQAISDDELRGKTAELKERINEYEILEDLIPEAFAIIKETARRLTSMVHYDVQLMGATVLHQGKIAEMATGEGKTLVATLPVYLNAISGMGVHLVTVNNYLARRDAQWNAPIFQFHGLTVDCIDLHQPNSDERRQAYLADITYGTNNEFGFDYLRDNMTTHPEYLVQKRHYYAIIDEIDSVLIDEARTPLIISGPVSRGDKQEYNELKPRIERLVRKQRNLVNDPLYFTIDEKNNQIEMTDKGRDEIAGAEDEKLRVKDEISRDYAEKSERLHAINQLLKAYTLFEKDVEYIVQDGKVMIVDEQTGRVLAGRRYSSGLHQAIEAKENVKVEAATQTFATVTLQNYFRMYHKLAGMTGTAETEEAEFYEIYKLDVVVIPTNRPIARDDQEDQVYKTKREKYNAVIDEVQALQERGQPVLVGTTSVEVSELLGRMLNRRKIKHNVLNAKQHQREAEIVSEAGKPGAITIATNMAGRGTDIKLGEGVKEAGGLAIIGTERHESRRIDRQLRGRAGRQGDPGRSLFYVSLEDDLMRLFGSERISKIMDRFGLEEGEVIQHSMISKSIGNAQKKVEQNNFAMRKRLLEYDDVMNSQREVIYRRRRNALYGDRIKIDLDNMLYDFCGTLVSNHIEMTDAEGLRMDCIRFLSVDPKINEQNLNDESDEALTDRVFQEAKAYYKRKSDHLADTLSRGIARIKNDNPNIERILIPFSDGSNKLQIFISVQEAIETGGRAVVDELEKVSTLSIIDDKWKDHLREMDELRTSVQNAVFEQKDPLLVYKFESFQLFQQALSEINQKVLSLIFKADLHVPENQQKQQAQSQPKRDNFSGLKTRHDDVENERKRQMDAERQVMAAAGGGQSERKLTRAQRRAQERKSKKGKR
ncbi:UNVERIFIED_CONTAM: hypothetical protein GTU68_024492 [Idotea baltica]|nr:hypothetical protein [Idotea baltica]